MRCGKLEDDNGASRLQHAVDLCQTGIQGLQVPETESYRASVEARRLERELESICTYGPNLRYLPAPAHQHVPHEVGTDGCASNNNLDLFAEMDMAAKLHKLNAMDPTVMDAVTVLRMATIEGAKALGMGETTGSIERGKHADVIVVDTKRPHLTPMYNPYSHLVYAARGDDVCHVVIHGKVVMENREIVTLDLHEVIERARKRSEDVRQWVKTVS